MRIFLVNHSFSFVFGQASFVSLAKEFELVGNEKLGFFVRGKRKLLNYKYNTFLHWHTF